MTGGLSKLDSRFRPIAQKLIDQLQIEKGIPLCIVSTIRTQEQQDENIRRGISWTRNSKHLPQPDEGLSWAVDLVPLSLMQEKNWAPADPLWWEIASAAVNLGLRSGMDWDNKGLPPVGQTRPKWDPGHVEWRGPKK